MKKQLLLVSILVFLILVFDQVIKIWVKTSLTDQDPPINLVGEWFRMIYIENQGMAFGTTLGLGSWGKLVLSIFRIAAITAIAWYLIKQWRRGVKTEYLLAIGLIFAGAFGNLIDSICYDFIFSDMFDPCATYNQLPGSGIYADCDYSGQLETRRTGFLFGNVVDMFQFNAHWPEWVPGIGGNEVFPAIWNLADASITMGVLMIIIRQRKYFPKKEAEIAPANTPEMPSTSEEEVSADKLPGEQTGE